MTLADFTRPALIIPRLGGHDRSTILREMCELLHRGERVADALTFFHAVLNREYLADTAIGGGIVVPHARHDSVSELSLVLGRTTEPVAWGRGASRSVRTVFLLAVPTGAATEYLRLLAAIARFSSEPSLVEWLRLANTESQILDVLALVELHPPRETSAPAPTRTACVVAPA